jgi:hypothetical protein
MTGISVDSRARVTDPARFNVIATTQAEDNERQRVEVSRSFVCRSKSTDTSTRKPPAHAQT